MSVDFPEPLGPITAIKSPFLTRKLTSSTATVVASPKPYSLLTSLSSIIFTLPTSVLLFVKIIQGVIVGKLRYNLHLHLSYTCCSTLERCPSGCPKGVPYGKGARPERRPLGLGDYIRNSMYYVYFLQSTDRSHFYIGASKNVSERLHKHSSGASKSTHPYRLAHNTHRVLFYKIRSNAKIIFS